MNNNKGKVIVVNKKQYIRKKANVIGSCDGCDLNTDLVSNFECPYLDECLLSGTILKQKQKEK